LCLIAVCAGGAGAGADGRGVLVLMSVVCWC
jgi:hypothetical protein